MRHGKTALALTAALVTAGTVTAATGATPAPADEPAVMGSCPDTGNEVSVPGGYAEWSITCESGRVKVRGKIEDTRADNDCAKAKGKNMNTGRWRSTKVCGWLNEKDIDWDLGKGKGAKVKLYLVDN
ncbi:hypothetical protein ACGFSB_29165 [Streptomyces sp. NPDC048441]|uniref:hypothetical protein n=1 Tax=Streptomyces sp. NPDC048441 TaxID=3365552 RepID=UPI003710B86F